MEFESENLYITSKRGHGEYVMLGMVKFWGYIYDFMALKLKGAPKGAPGGKGLKTSDVAQGPWFRPPFSFSPFFFA